MKYICCIYLANILIYTKQVNSKVMEDNVLSRSKRYLAFPEGSVFAVMLCDTVATIMEFEVFYEGINWGVTYDLPNETTIDSYAKDKFKEHRRHRRDLYTRFETVMDSFGYNGRSCIYRALCEAPGRFRQKSQTLSEELLRLLFKFPLQSLSDREPEEHKLYQLAYRKGKKNKPHQCSEIFPECPISLIDLALGYYDSYEKT